MPDATLFSYFSEIDDPRIEGKITYSLFEILFLTFAATLAGCEGWEEIEDFGECHLEWLRRYSAYEHGAPHHDTIARLIARLKPEAFQSSFANWMKETEQLTDGEVIAIDGKTLRRSYDREDRRSMIHMVNAFATRNGVSLGQVKTDSKSNEITAIPKLLNLLDIKGCLVTIDAMGCQKEIAQTICNQGGDYLLAVKGNHKHLHQAIKTAFLTEFAELCSHPNHAEKNRGRIEYREARLLPVSALPNEIDVTSWPGVQQIGMLIAYRRTKEHESIDYRYYITSSSLTEERFLNAARAHWCIENSLHWVLDVAMKEDSCPIYAGNSAENMAIIRQMALNQLKRETTKKAGIKRKQRMAAMNLDYLETVIRATG